MHEGKDAADKEMVMLPETVNARKQLVKQGDAMVTNTPDLIFAHRHTHFQAAEGWAGDLAEGHFQTPC